MLALLETISGSTGISIETIVALGGVLVTVVLFVLGSNQRASKDSDRRHEILRTWVEGTFIRKDLYTSEASNLTKKVDRIEAMVELIWRAQRKEGEPRE